MIICIKWVKIKRIAIVNCSDRKIIKSKESMALVRDHSWIISVPIESNRFSKWRAHAYHRSIWVPHPTLPPWSSVHRYTFFLSERWNPGILPQDLSSICFLVVFFFFKTKFTVSGAYIWHGWSKTHSDWHAWSFFQNVCTCYVCIVVLA